MRFIILVNWLLFAKAFSSQHFEDLCKVSGCSCDEEKLEVRCKCVHKEILRIGDPEHTTGVSLPPPTAKSLSIDECHHVEIFSKTLNSLPELKDIKLNKAHKIVIHPRIFNSRRSKNGFSINLDNFEISNVRNLEVKRNSFEGINIEGTFTLKNVLLNSVPSLAFNFDSVNEFVISGSRFRRISMWGIKLPKCHEFRSSEKTQYFSLASHALYMSCQNVIVVDNIFGSLHDASMNVTYHYAEIRKNTFETITGKPFVNMKPLSNEASFIFRENLFRVDATLPYNSLSMPNFDDSVDYSVENNHFVCDCDKLAWFLSATTSSDAHTEIVDAGTKLFLLELYSTAGKCIECDSRSCAFGKEDFSSFVSRVKVTKKGNDYSCSESEEPLPDKFLVKKVDEEKGIEEMTESEIVMEEIEASRNLESSILQDSKKEEIKKEEEKEAEDASQLEYGSNGCEDKRHSRLFFFVFSSLFVYLSH